MKNSNKCANLFTSLNSLLTCAFLFTCVVTSLSYLARFVSALHLHNIHTRSCFGSCCLSFPPHSLFKEWLLGCPRIWNQTPEIPTCGTVGRLVPLVTVSFMSGYSNTGGDTNWFSWQDGSASLWSNCASSLSASVALRLQRLTCYEYVLTAGEQQRISLNWDLCGHLPSMKMIGRPTGGVRGVKQDVLS